VVDWVYSLQQTFNVPINLFVLTVQFLAIACVFKVVWMRLAALAYDVLHIGIYLLGGLFFSWWIWNNIAVLVAIKGQKSFKSSAVAACLTTILLGYPPIGLVNSAWLAWFDLTNARQTYLEAVTDNDDVVRVPFSAFLSNSHSVGHAYMANVEMQGQYPFTWWASGTYEQFKQIPHCAPPPGAEGQSLEEPSLSQRRLEAIKVLVRENHKKLLQISDQWGNLAIYFRHHHLPSNPFMYLEFNNLDLHSVKGYNFVIASTCHGVEQGKSIAKAISISKVYIDVR
jgi:hypothetical protein